MLGGGKGRLHLPGVDTVAKGDRIARAGGVVVGCCAVGCVGSVRGGVVVTGGGIDVEVGREGGG